MNNATKPLPLVTVLAVVAFVAMDSFEYHGQNGTRQYSFDMKESTFLYALTCLFPATIGGLVSKGLGRRYSLRDKDDPNTKSASVNIPEAIVEKAIRTGIKAAMDEDRKSSSNNGVQ